MGKQSVKFYAAFLLMSISLLLTAQNTNAQESKNTTNDIKYNSEKAKKYGADKYGMKTYVMAFLKRGPNRDLDSIKAFKLQMAHLKNIQKMAEDGKLVLAGPFLDNSDLRGIYIFNVETIEEAENLTKTDPAIEAGSLEMELKKWYGSAALIEVNKIHKSLAEKSITDN